MLELVTTPDQVSRNIRAYVQGLDAQPRLAARLKRHTAWYAIKEEGVWLFGPSKFVGYVNMSPTNYFEEDGKHGGKTEAELTLSEWFVPVELSSALGRDIEKHFRLFVGRFGKTPKSGWRVSVLKSHIGAEAQRSSTATEWRDRIAIDQGICGGRPRIRGTRVRVSDIIEMLAAGVEKQTILTDFPYLTEEDVNAALAYAALSVSHRIVDAA